MTLRSGSWGQQDVGKEEKVCPVTLWCPLAEAGMLIKKRGRWISEAGTQKTLLNQEIKIFIKLRQRDPEDSVFLRSLPMSVSTFLSSLLNKSLLFWRDALSVVCDFHSFITGDKVPGYNYSTPEIAASMEFIKCWEKHHKKQWTSYWPGGQVGWKKEKKQRQCSVSQCISQSW